MFLLLRPEFHSFFDREETFTFTSGILQLFSRNKMFLLLRPLELVVEMVLVMVIEVVVTLSYT